MNKVILSGRLTKDPDVRYSQGDKPIAIAAFTLAVDRKFKKDGEQNADFINCRSFGKNAEFAEKYLRKGTKIIVEGHWQTGSFTGKDGKKVYTNECIVDSHEFAENKTSSHANDNGSEIPPDAEGSYFMQIPDGIEEELPFK